MSEQIRVYRTFPHSCPYLEDEHSTNLVIDPELQPTPQQFSALIDQGFRRSGEQIYRPHCDDCQACVAVRVPVKRFHPNRSQRRNQQRNADLSVQVFSGAFRDDWYALYERYLKTRHADGGMDDTSPEQFERFLCSAWGNTQFVEFRLREKLMAVAVVDELMQGYSAMYTFFDPDEARRGLGTYAVLWQIEQARRYGYDYVYLGYWIQNHPKMDYKRRFQPLEQYTDHHWQAVQPA